jgi:hypothetical protein
MDRKPGAMPGRDREVRTSGCKEHNLYGKGSLDGVRLALAPYRRELLVDPGVHIRPVETAR